MKEFKRVLESQRESHFAISTVLMLVVVVDFPVEEFERERQRISQHFLVVPKGTSFDLRVYSFPDLKQRFGLS